MADDHNTAAPSTESVAERVNANTATASTEPPAGNSEAEVERYEEIARKLSSYGVGTVHSGDALGLWRTIVVGLRTVSRLAGALGGYGTFIRVAIRSSAISKQRMADCVRQLQAIGVASEADCKVLLNMPFMFAAAAEILGSRDRALEAFLTGVTGAKPEETGLDFTEVARAMPEGSTPRDAMMVYSRLMKSMNAADAKAGVRRSTDIEDTPTMCGFDVNFCAYAEAFRIAGVPEGCRVVCAGDEAFIPPAIEPLGLHFERTGTIGNGNRCCDFRFVVGPKPQPTAAPMEAAPAMI